MAYPPTLPPANRTDSTVSAVNHAADHNKIAAALADFITELGGNPSGAYATLTARLADMPTTPELAAGVLAAQDARDAAIAAAAAAAAPTDSMVASLLPAASGSATAAALLTAIGVSTAASDGGRSLKLSPSTQVGAADLYTVFGGSTSFPNTIGSTSLAFVAGYDNHIWDNSIASHLTSHHGINGGPSGHATTSGGSRGANFGGYAFVGGGFENYAPGNYSGVVAGRHCSAGGQGHTTLAVAAVAGDTQITVADSTGMAVGQFVYIGYAPDLNRAVITNIAGNVVTLNTFQHITTTDVNGTRTGTALVASVAMPIGTVVHFSTVGGSAFAGGIGGDDCHAHGAYSGYVGGSALYIGGQGAFGAGTGGRVDPAAAGGAVFGSAPWVREQNALAIGSGKWDANSPLGASQTGLRSQKLITTTATTTSLQIAGKVAADSANAYDLQVVARDPATGDCKVWRVTGAYKRVGTGTVTNVGTPTITVVGNDAGAAAWTLTTLGGSGTFNLSCTGEAGKTIRWSAGQRLTENS